MISVVVSLTLAPTLAALFMRAPVHHAARQTGFGERLLALLRRAASPGRSPIRQSMLGVFGADPRRWRSPATF